MLCVCTDIFPVSISDRKNYRLIASTDKKTGVHARIIWCCSWTHDSKYFITGSRDGKVAVWGHKGATSETVSTLPQYTLRSKPLELPDLSVTAVAVAPVNIAPNVYLVAVGLESGCINMYKWSSVSTGTLGDWQRCLELDNSYPSCNVVVFYHSVYTHLFSSVPLLYELSSSQALLPISVFPQLLLLCSSFCMASFQTYWPLLISVLYTHAFDKYSFIFHRYPVICTNFLGLFWKIEHG